MSKSLEEMSKILVDVNGKGNLCCSRSIDLERGCKNQCIGCYGTKTSMMGADRYFNNVISKEYNEKVFRTSCKSEVRKGYKFARLGKHSDGGHGHLNEIFKSAVKVCTEEGLRLVIVSKSLEFDEEVAKLLVAGNHTLHMSLGMKTQAQSEVDRVLTCFNYGQRGVNAFYRIVEDVTKPLTRPIPKLCGDPLYSKCIITPMRFISKEAAEVYEADLSKYKFVNGYYRPQEMHESWNVFTSWCGEVGDQQKCCFCLTGE